MSLDLNPFLEKIKKDNFCREIRNEIVEAFEKVTDVIENNNIQDLNEYQKKSDESLDTNNKEIVGAINEVHSQYEDIANEQPTDLTLDSTTNLLQLVNLKGSKLGNGITLPISDGGTSQHLHIKYSNTGAPQLQSQMFDTPNNYIGLCVDANEDAPINPFSYTWYKWKGEDGAKGEKGDTGATPQLAIGEVTTLDSGSNATANITGANENPVLNLGIPRGNDASDTLVNTEIADSILALTTEKYQTTTIADETEITLPTVESFTEIHLFFNTDVDLTLVLPNCKWQNGTVPAIGANKVYEFIFTFTDEWLGGVIEYVA